MGTPALGERVGGFAGGRAASTWFLLSKSNLVNMLVGIISRPSSLTSQLTQALLNYGL